MSEQEKKVRSIRFDAEKLVSVVKENLITDHIRLAAIEIANKLIHDLVTLDTEK